MPIFVIGFMKELPISTVDVVNWLTYGRKMKVLLAGASGVIGTALQETLQAQGHEVHKLHRSSQPVPADPYQWAPQLGYVHPEAIEWAEAVISLSGAPLTRLPWTPRYRRKILQSRVESAQTLAQQIRESSNPPLVWVSGSAVGYYGSRPGEELTESATQGSGFLAEVVSSWEQATMAAADATRLVHARTGIVVAKSGAFGPLIALTKIGLGGKLGSGTQHWPWISLQDEVAALIHLATSSQLSGAVNLAGPSPATVTRITRTLANLLKRPYFAHVPGWLLRIPLGMAADELILGDQKVVPQRLLADGFTFTDPTITHALDSIG